MSRTDRVTTPSAFIPVRASEAMLATVRPREGFRPTRPQCDDGMRIDPEMSLAWAAGTSRAATAAAEPPDDPPGVRSRSHGLCVGAVGLRLARADGGELGCVGAPERDQPGGTKGKRQRRIAGRPGSRCRAAPACPSSTARRPHGSGSP